MLVVGGLAELLLGSRLRMHWSGASLSLSLSIIIVLAELRALLLQRRWLFEGNFAGLGGHAGACACPSKGIDPSCLICCLCFALARSVLLLVAGAKHVVFCSLDQLAAAKKFQTQLYRVRSPRAAQGSIPMCCQRCGPWQGWWGALVGRGGVPAWWCVVRVLAG